MGGGCVGEREGRKLFPPEEGRIFARWFLLYGFYYTQSAAHCGYIRFLIIPNFLRLSEDFKFRTRFQILSIKIQRKHITKRDTNEIQTKSITRKTLHRRYLKTKKSVMKGNERCRVQKDAGFW